MKTILLFLCLSFFSLAEARETICLNMIVKDEKPIIQKCLESVKPFIDYWVIVDTGSTDGTQQAIREYMKDIPGELHERPWVNFAHNRNEALGLAKEKGDYCLVIDADETLACAKSFKMPPLSHDLYAITIRLTQTDGSVSSTPRAFLIKKQFKALWKGVLHETIYSDAPFSTALVPDICIHTDMKTGHRSQDPHKHLKDAKTLKTALEADPANSRYQFYLGVSYELAGEMQLALEAFDTCSRLKTTDHEERFRSLFQVGVIQERLGKPAAVFLASYEKAFQDCPKRAEPLFFMANYYIKINNFKKAYDLLTQAVELPLPVNSPFVEEAVYTWASLYNLVICTEKLKKPQETQKNLQRLLRCPKLPAPYREIAEKKQLQYGNSGLRL